MSTPFRLLWLGQIVSLLVFMAAFLWAGALIPSLVFLLVLALVFGDLGLMLYREKMPEEKVRYHKSCAMGMADMLCTLLMSGLLAWIVFEVVTQQPPMAASRWNYWAFLGLLFYIVFRKIYIYKNFTYL